MDDCLRLESIPSEIVEKICSEIQEEAHKNWDSPTARWCWSCQYSSEDDPRKLAYFNKPGNRGCHLMNVRYVQILQENPDLTIH